MPERGLDRALVVVDVQRDFCPGGPLATPRGAEVAADLTMHLLVEGVSYTAIAATCDWHIDPEGHFAPEGEDPDFRETWPRHCEAGTDGARTHPAFATRDVDAWFRKGEYTPAYSGFEGYLAEGPDGSDAADSADAADAGPSLAEWLRGRGIGEVVVAGIATDFCVRATVLDSLREGFRTTVLRRLCAAVDEESGEAALAEMEAAGAAVA